MRQTDSAIICKRGKSIQQPFKYLVLQIFPLVSERLMLLPEHVTVSQQLQTSGNDVFLTRKPLNASKMVIRQKSGNSEGFSDSKNKKLLPLITYITVVQIPSVIWVLNTEVLAICLPLNDEIYTEGSREKQNRNSCSGPRSSTSWIFCFQNLELAPVRGKLSATYCARQCIVPVTVIYSYCITTEEEVIFLTGAYLPDFFTTINVNLALVHQIEH